VQFNSVVFPVFLAAVLILHRLLPWRWGKIMLVAASYFFYGMAHPWYCFLLFLSSVVDFIAARWIHGSESSIVRKRVLTGSILFGLGLLGFFKYIDFFINNVNEAAQWFGHGGTSPLNLLLPVGISFYTFQTMSYVIDVYRKKIAPTRDFTSFALYVSFFPQLVAGPIERADHLLPQFKKKQPVSREDFMAGFERMLWGFFKKVVLADRLGLLINTAWKNPQNADTTLVFLAAFGFTMQLYLDFSGYTDIALGAARLFGVRLSENFRWTLLSRNPSEIWSRWHITLSTWLRDYVYRPLGGTLRHRPWRTAFNTLFTMTLMGLWHGANWNFIFFGLFAGLGVAIYQHARLFTERVHSGPFRWETAWRGIPARIAVFFYLGFLTSLFRAPDLQTAGIFFSRLFAFSWDWKGSYAIGFLILAGVITAHFIRGLYMTSREPIRMPAAFRGLFWFVLFTAIVYGAVPYTEQFIYFQF
jgi:D-alanyl-lipoteichoic acid acyltransferase DltB (MBOAT superfamily)